MSVDDSKYFETGAYCWIVLGAIWAMIQIAKVAKFVSGTYQRDKR